MQIQVQLSESEKDFSKYESVNQSFAEELVKIEIPEALKDPTSKQTAEVKITDFLKTFADLKSRVETNSIRMQSI